jgi:hypothetical protein
MTAPCAYGTSTGPKAGGGAIHAKSQAGILFIDGPSGDNSRRSKRVDSGVTESVAVDSHLNRAFVAVQSREFSPSAVLRFGALRALTGN